MEITVEMASKISREYGGRTKWGVHPKGSPKDYWVDIYVTDRPKPGQVFNIGSVKETPSKDGAKIFREAEIIGPATAPQQNGQSHRMVGNLKNAPSGWPVPETPPAPKTIENGVQMFKPNDKIKWNDWCEMARAASQLSYELEPDLDAADLPTRPSCEARAAIVNTVMIAYSSGKLELPTEAGPVSREPGDDGDAYADPNKTVPWGNQ